MRAPDTHSSPGPVRFDETLEAWIVSRYADVSAALRDPGLSASGASDGAPGLELEVRDVAAHVLSPDRLAAWRAALAPSAHRFAAALPAGRTVDLVGDFAEPWSLELAVTATGAPAADGPRLAGLARRVFLAAARATRTGSSPDARAAASELARGLPGPTGSIEVQGFVALAMTLPCVLAGIWLSLLGHPDEAGRLRARPDLMPRAVEELLRHAGPARAVFRRALTEVEIGGTIVEPGARVALMLAAANRDPERYAEPSRLDLSRPAGGHVAFGGGAHACPGASVIRPAVAAATEALLSAAEGMEIAGEVEWTGGFAIRGPASLPVTLRRRSGR